MAEDESLRGNRLALLAHVASLAREVADLGKVVEKQCSEGDMPNEFADMADLGYTSLSCWILRSTEK